MSALRSPCCGPRVVTAATTAFASVTPPRKVVGMGDKSPKSKAKSKQQDEDQKKQAQVAHDEKQAPPPTSIGKPK